MIRGIILDFDGLILDTEVPDYESWREIYQEYGCLLPLENWVASIGTHSGLFDPYDYLQARVPGGLNRESVCARRRRRFWEMIEAQPVLPGVEACLASAGRYGLKLGVASSSSREWVEGHLLRLGLLNRFDCITTSDDVTHVKPDPELYQRAAVRLALGTAEVIALEDSPNGILAARRAGVFCIAIPNPMTRKLPLDAELRLDSLDEVSLEELVRRVDDHRRRQTESGP